MSYLFFCLRLLETFITFSLLLLLVGIEMNPQVDKVVRRTTMVATAVASYLLLTADYGPEPNALDPVSFLSSL